MRYPLVVLLVLLAGCAPPLQPQQLPRDCAGHFSGEQLRRGQWLQGHEAWRLRQGILLETGLKKVPLEGLLLLDLERETARLVALNEIGLVLFDLQVTAEGYQVHRAIPQLQSRAELMAGIAASLRRAFLQVPLPESEAPAAVDNLQRLTVPVSNGAVRFDFDCLGRLRELKAVEQRGNWLVQYNRYREFSGQLLPEEIIYYDRAQALKLSFWVREARQEP